MRHHATLRYVDAIARHGSIRRAAEALAITPSALNRRLLALEEELDAPLFERRARGVRLSTAGEIFIHHARRQMAEMARVRATIEDMKGARRGHVAIALDASLPASGLARMLAATRAQHAGVTFAVHSCDRGTAARLLHDYTADLAIAVEPERGGAFVTVATAEVGLDAVLPQCHALAERGAALRLHEYLTHPLVLPPRGRSARFVLDAAAARRDVEIAPVIEGNRRLTDALVRDGVGLGLRMRVLPPGTALGPTGIGAGLVAVPLDRADVPSAVLHIGQLRDRALPVPAARFAELMVRQLAVLAGEMPSERT